MNAAFTSEEPCGLNSSIPMHVNSKSSYTAQSNYEHSCTSEHVEEKIQNHFISSN